MHYKILDKHSYGMVRQPKVYFPAKHSAIAPVVQVLNMQTQTPNLLFPFPQNRLNMQLRGKGLMWNHKKNKKKRTENATFCSC